MWAIYELISPTYNATLTRIFFFFLGWARPDNRLVSSGWARPDNRLVSSGWARPVASSLQAVKKFIFIFILHMGLNGSIPVAGPFYISPA